MAKFVVAGFVLAIYVGVASAEDDAEAVRNRSAQYAAAVLKRDKDRLASLLHDEYQGSLPGDIEQRRDTSQAVLFWNNPRATFSTFKTSTESVRLLGATAIERGSMWGEQRVGKYTNSFGSSNFGGVSYLRVWAKDQHGWRVVDEQYR